MICICIYNGLYFMHLSENNSYPASDEIWVVLLVFHDVDPVEDQVVLPGLRIHDDDKDDDNVEDNGDYNSDDDYPEEHQVVLPGLKIHEDDKDDDDDNVEDNGDDNSDDDYPAEHQVVLPGLRNQDGKQHVHEKGPPCQDPRVCPATLPGLAPYPGGKYSDTLLEKMVNLQFA